MDKPSVAADWDRYWRGSDSGALQGQGQADPALKSFWEQLLQGQGAGPRLLLDLASGNGDLVGLALGLGIPGLSCMGLDGSQAAAAELPRRYPGVAAITADLLQAPFPDHSIDLVVSQFGVEYAGIEGLVEAARLVANGGVIAAVMHMEDGAIYRECEQNREIAESIREEQVLVLARAAFSAGFALNTGSGSVDAFKQAERRFAPCIKFLENTMQRFGHDSASGLVSQLYRDIAHMYRRMSAFAAEDVFNWIDGMCLELEAYLGRMEAMLGVAIDAEGIEKITARLSELGFERISTNNLELGNPAKAAAWTVVAYKS